MKLPEKEIERFRAHKAGMGRVTTPTAERTKGD